MLHCVQTPENIAGNDSGTSEMDRKRTRLKWQQQQFEQPRRSYFTESQFNVLPINDSMTEIEQFQALINNDFAFREITNQSIKDDPGFENGCQDLGKCPLPRIGFLREKTGFLSATFPANNSPEIGVPLSRTASCPPEVVAERVPEPEKMTLTTGRESFKKRKSVKAQNPKGIETGETREKKKKGDLEELMDSKVTEENNNKNNREASEETSKENSKQDYIHVRARRGQATDSHSLAERVRREKISERMKYLQDLVPGCNKITGKAGMLDEIINYVQSLQRQVEFLSMKLAAVNPRLDFNVEVFPPCTGGFPAAGMSSELASPAYLQFNPVQPCGLDMPGLRRTTSAPVSVPEIFLDSSCFTQQPQQYSSNWETDLQSLYNVEFHQERSNIYPFQPFSGTMEDINLKMEM